MPHSFADWCSIAGIPLSILAFWYAVYRIRLTNRTYHFAAEFAEVGG